MPKSLARSTFFRESKIRPRPQFIRAKVRAEPHGRTLSSRGIQSKRALGKASLHSLLVPSHRPTGFLNHYSHAKGRMTNCQVPNTAYLIQEVLDSLHPLRIETDEGDGEKVTYGVLGSRRSSSSTAYCCSPWRWSGRARTWPPSSTAPPRCSWTPTFRG